MAFLFARLTRLSRPFLVLSIALSLTLALNSNSFSQDPDPETEAVVYFNKGQDAHEKKDFALAIENYDKAIKLVPDFPEAELQRGNALVSIGRLDDAETSLARGEGTEITRESMRELTDGIMERAGARIAAEQKAAR